MATMNGKTLYEQIKAVIDESPKKTALIFENSTFSYKELDEGILNAASRFNALGVKKHDVVTVLLPNCPEAVFIFYGLSALGAISYNVHPLTPASSLPKMMGRVKSKYLVCLSNAAKENKEALPEDVKVISINPYEKINFVKSFVFSMMGKKSNKVINFSKIKGNEDFEIHKLEQEREDAVYMNTGGTTGEMKVVRLSNESINHIASKGFDILGSKDLTVNMLAALPLFHVFGLGMGLHTPLSMGGASCLMIKFSTKEAIRQIRRGNVTITLGVPALFNALVSKEKFYGPHLSKQVAAYLGGDSAPEGLIEKWDEAMEKYGSSCRLCVGYGLTETSTACNVNCLGGRNRKGSVGRPVSGVKNKILSLDGQKECLPNELGEILIGGPSLMNGYYGDEELTSASTFVDESGERWLRTKDFGYIDEDGYLFFKQRTRRIVKVNGETLCPSDIENVVNALSGIYECFCFGKPDERKGQVFKLVVVIRRGKNTWTEDETKEKITDAISKALPPAYMPSEITFVHRLPHTPIGKIDPVKTESLYK